MKELSATEIEVVILHIAYCVQEGDSEGEKLLKGLFPDVKERYNEVVSQAGKKNDFDYQQLLWQ